MKRTLHIITLFAALGLASCTDWLTEKGPGTTELGDFFTSGETAIQTVNAAYVPLSWEFNNTYFCEWFIGDVASDDALKGGQNIADAYDIENFKTVSTNTLLLDFYRAQFQGIGRCNLVLANVPGMETDETMDEKTRERLIGEAYFLRAYYYFRLVRMFGGVPKVEAPITSSDDWRQPRATADEIYTLILSDLDNAQSRLWKKSEYADEDMGRATRGAALAMLLKVNLYVKDYDTARTWGAELLKMGDEEGEYSLCTNYEDNFTLAGENGPESVFEIQYMEDPQSDYGEGYGYTRGTMTTILTRSRSTLIATTGAGWGFNHPTQDLYDEFEENDPRREATIINPADDQMVTPSEEIYLGNRYLNRKYAMMTDNGGAPYRLSHETRSPINNKQIRYADVLLMYAEACLESNTDLGAGRNALNRVRARVGLSEVDLTRENLRHERRVELAMEGHRWFDLCRWGIVGETMNAYMAAESEEARAQMGTFIAGKHELMPIPSEEVRLGGLTQNPGY